MLNRFKTYLTIIKLVCKHIVKQSGTHRQTEIEKQQTYRQSKWYKHVKQCGNNYQKHMVHIFKTYVNIVNTCKTLSSNMYTSSNKVVKQTPPTSGNQLHIWEYSSKGDRAQEPTRSRHIVWNEGFAGVR
jgi:hypothetical protein